MHGASLAKELQIKKVIIPVTPGTFSALGMLMTAPMQDFIRTRILANSKDTIKEVKAIFEAMKKEAREFMVAADYPAKRLSFQLYADMRYLGQEHTVRVPVEKIDSKMLADSFHTLHEHAYTFRLESPTELVNFHVTAIVKQDPVDLSRYAPKPGARLKTKGKRQVYFEGGWLETSIYERDSLPAKKRIKGPAIIEEPAASTVIHPGMTAYLDELGNIILETGV